MRACAYVRIRMLTQAHTRTHILTKKLAPSCASGCLYVNTCMFTHIYKPWPGKLAPSCASTSMYMNVCLHTYTQRDRKCWHRAEHHHGLCIWIYVYIHTHTVTRKAGTELCIKVYVYEYIFTYIYTPWPEILGPSCGSGLRSWPEQLPCLPMNG